MGTMTSCLWVIPALNCYRIPGWPLKDPHAFMYNGQAFDFKPELCPYADAVEQTNACTVATTSQVCDAFNGTWIDANGGTCIIDTHALANTADVAAPTNTVNVAARSIDNVTKASNHLSVGLAHTHILPYLMCIVSILIGLGLVSVAVKIFQMRGNANLRRNLQSRNIKSEYKDFMDENIACLEVKEV
jgi:hypothetical protein